jgi:hypothetical protein
MFLAGVSPSVGNIRPEIVDVSAWPRESVILDRALGNPFGNQLLSCPIW